MDGLLDVRIHLATQNATHRSPIASKSVRDLLVAQTLFAAKSTNFSDSIRLQPARALDVPLSELGVLIPGAYACRSRVPELDIRPLLGHPV